MIINHVEIDIIQIILSEVICQTILKLPFLRLCTIASDGFAAYLTTKLGSFPEKII